MKIRLKTKPLLAAVTSLNKVIPAKSFYPILENILAETVPGGLRLTATDLETTMVTLIPENETTDYAVSREGKACIPAKFLLNVLKQVENESINIDCPENGQAIILSWDSGRSQLPVVDSKDYPEPATAINDGITFGIGSADLREALTATAYACGDDDIRPVMTGILFDLTQEGLNLVATDSRILVVHSIPGIAAEKPGQFILPKKQAAVIKALCADDGTVTVKMNTENASFSFADTTIYVQGCKGRFPKYRDVIPKANTSILTADRKALVASIKRISVCANRSSLHIKMSLAPDLIEARMILAAEDAGFGVAAKEESAVDYAGGEMTIGFRAPYLIDILGNLECEQVKIAFLDPQKAVLITPSEEEEGKTTKAVIMPIRIA